MAAASVAIISIGKSAASTAIASPKGNITGVGSGAASNATSLATSGVAGVTTASTTSSLTPSRVAGGQSAATGAAHPSEPRILDRRRLADLVKEVDPLEQLDDDVEELLMQIADDFIDNVVTASCQIAKHRKATTVEVKDVQLHLEHNWNMWVPGFGSEELRPYKKAATTEAHKQRVALIKKVQKKL